jgi:hypothetical protein
MIQNILHSAPRAVVITLLLFAPGSRSLAQASSAHQALLLEVVEVNKINVSSGFVSLVLGGSSTADAPLEGATTDCSLIWTTNGYDKKITVARTAASEGIQLRLAVAEWEGTPAVVPGEIEFQEDAAYDFLRGISKAAARCRLRLAATAETRKQSASELHLLTYTITSD